jgi:hypothetical protein
MNSEQWEQLWREQAAPPSAVHLDRFFAEMQGGVDQWERDLDDRDRLLLKIQFFVALTGAADLFSGRFVWATQAGQLGNLCFMILLLVRSAQRRRIYGDFGLPIRKRLERLEHRLRRRADGKIENLLFVTTSCLLSSGMWLRMHERGLGVAGGWIFAGLLLGLMVWAYREQARADRVRLQGMLTKVDRMRNQLEGSAPAAGDLGSDLTR